MKFKVPAVSPATAAAEFPGVNVNLLLTIEAANPVTALDASAFEEPGPRRLALFVVLITDPEWTVSAAMVAADAACGRDACAKVNVVTSSADAVDGPAAVVVSVNGTEINAPATPVLVGEEMVTVPIVEAAFAGTTDNRPKPNADTATSAMRLIDVFVDICFLSLRVELEDFSNSAWLRRTHSSDMSVRSFRTRATFCAA